MYDWKVFRVNIAYNENKNVRALRHLDILSIKDFEKDDGKNLNSNEDDDIIEGEFTN